jgi:hypothetical protein
MAKKVLQKRATEATPIPATVIPDWFNLERASAQTAGQALEARVREVLAGPSAISVPPQPPPDPPPAQPRDWVQTWLSVVRGCFKISVYFLIPFTAFIALATGSDKGWAAGMDILKSGLLMWTLMPLLIATPMAIVAVPARALGDSISGRDPGWDRSFLRSQAFLAVLATLVALLFVHWGLALALALVGVLVCVITAVLL